MSIGHLKLHHDKFVIQNNHNKPLKPLIHITHVTLYSIYVYSAWNNSRTSDIFQPKLLTVQTILVLARQTVQTKVIILQIFLIKVRHHELSIYTVYDCVLILGHGFLIQKNVTVWTNYITVVLFRLYVWAYFSVYFKHWCL